MQTVITETTTTTTRTVTHTYLKGSPIKEFQNAYDYRLQFPLDAGWEAKMTLCNSLTNLKRVLEDLHTIQAMRRDKNAHWRLHYCLKDEVRKFQKKYSAIAADEMGARLMPACAAIALSDQVSDETAFDMLEIMLDAVSLTVAGLEAFHVDPKGAAHMLEPSLTAVIETAQAVLNDISGKPS